MTSLVVLADNEGGVNGDDVDASGVNGEGLQIGEGNLDFYNFFKTFDKLNSHASFIPEVWQGHKNNGEGFWYALNLLEEYSSY